eukprot:CAMPEP_0117446620 /NCGR_PEP_ID=MMETSP0759-20121206/6443_1 /TAXON_ID=63605 /ORGANISM="Percolomonas cosmopolitus, Strain WS" /LENGTH=95 /DNA_ID=CAMNT_0005238909 /DNA_START=291 /DNA_END=578 /DNA_ORIENTATION=+
MDLMDVDASTEQNHTGGTKRKARKSLLHTSKKPRLGEYMDSPVDADIFMNDDEDFGDMIADHLTGEELKKKLKRDLVDKDFYNDFDDDFDDNDLD